MATEDDPRPVERGIAGEHGPELVGLRNDGEPIETPEAEESLPPGDPAESWPSGLSLSAGVPYTATGRVDGPLGEDSASKLLAPILMRQIGWLDSEGRIWGPGEITTEMLGGASLTPLLVQVSHD